MNSGFKLVLFGNSFDKILFAKKCFVKGKICSVISQILMKSSKFFNVLYSGYQVDRYMSVPDNYAIDKICLEGD